MSDDNKQLTSDEVKAKVIEEFGFDADTQGEQIDKLTNERIDNQKNLSKTIEQKAKYREQGVKAGILDPTTFEPIDKKPEGDLNNKPNTEQSGATMEDMMLVNKGLSLAEIKMVKEASKVLGIPALDAHDNDFVQQKINEGRQEAQEKANSLPASNSSAPAQRAKTVANMTDEEHKAFAEEKLAGAMNA